MVDRFTRGYVHGALWSSTDENGEPFDRRFDSGDISLETLASMASDCGRFQTENDSDLREASELDEFRAGVLFWLNRNRHGSGFWDETSIPQPIRDRLSDAAHAFGEVDLYIGDDGMVWA